MEKLTRQQMVELVDRIIRVDGEEEEIDRWLDQLEFSTSNPHISDLIWHPKPGDENLTAEQIVDKALQYRPFAM